MEIEWSRLKAAEIAALARQGAIVIAPIGATEQHGPHLPSMVDWRCAQEVAQRAARLMQPRHPVLVTPTMPFGMSEHHMSLSGTITLDYATMAALVGCVVDSAIRHGFKRIFVLNGHGGNTEALRTIVTRADRRAQAAVRHRHLLGYRRRPIKALLDKQTALLHACEAETSMLMASGTGAGRSRDPVTDARGLYPGPLRYCGRQPGCLSLAPAVEPLAHRRDRRCEHGEC